MNSLTICDAPTICDPCTNLCSWLKCFAVSVLPRGYKVVEGWRGGGMVGLKLCLQPYSESSLLPPLPPLPFLPRPSWAGGNIAEIVYHVANGSVLIIAVRVKRTVWKKGAGNRNAKWEWHASFVFTNGGRRSDESTLIVPSDNFENSPKLW